MLLGTRPSCNLCRTPLFFICCWAPDFKKYICWACRFFFRKGPCTMIKLRAFLIKSGGCMREAAFQHAACTFNLGGCFFSSEKCFHFQFGRLLFLFGKMCLRFQFGRLLFFVGCKPLSLSKNICWACLLFWGKVPSTMIKPWVTHRFGWAPDPHAIYV